jgi:hypothetical protein
MGSPRSLSIGALQGSRDSPSDGWRLRQNRDGSTAYVDQDTVWPKSTWLISRSSAVSFLNESLRKIKKVLLIDSLACLFMSISDWKEISCLLLPTFLELKTQSSYCCYFLLFLLAVGVLYSLSPRLGWLCLQPLAKSSDTPMLWPSFGAVNANGFYPVQWL